MTKYILPVLFFLISFISYPYNGKTHIIIDTDVAVDDLRAICLMLASNKTEVMAITTSDGALQPKEGLIKVRALLRSFGHEGIPTAMGEITQPDPPSWWQFSQHIFWGDENNINNNTEQSAPELMISTIDSEKNPTTIVCLGSMTNIAKAIRLKPEIKSRIERIVWYNDDIHPATGVNYEIDIPSADYIFNSGISISVVSNDGDIIIGLKNKLLNEIKNINTPYAQLITLAHRSDEVQQSITQGHLRLWDDMVAISLISPELFNSKSFGEYPNHSISYPNDSMKIEIAILNTLSGKNNYDLVFEKFPDEPSVFNADIRNYIPEIIEKYGSEEWKIVAVTNELHGHIGIYSLIGAKMGLRAREYFSIGTDELTVVSFAGTKPPISCMNDGLQVSTGATLGMGTISVVSEEPMPRAKFSFKNTTIEIRLNQDLKENIKHDLAEIVKKTGLNTEKYWLAVREYALKCWYAWDRKNIFEIEVVK